MTLETGAEMVKESSCTVATQEVPSRALWKATPWNFHSKYWTQGLALPQKVELLQSRTGNFLQPKQTVTFWQAMWKQKQQQQQTTACSYYVTKWPCYYNWPNLSPALRLGLHWQALSRNLFCIHKYNYLKKREVLTSLNFTCCCSLSTESVIACISDAPYFCWIMFSIPLSNASST